MAATVDAPDEATLSLRSRYPRTVEAFLGMANGERALRAVLDLERTWIALNSGVPAQEAGWRRRRWGEPFAYVASADELPPVPPKDRYDVVVAGGGLGLVAGVALARRGLRVLVFDRDRVGAAHREWNISERELGALSRWGMFGRDE